mgnify:FL=1
MKKVLPLFVLLLAFHTALLAQSVPQGMKYQAVARDTKGQVLTDRPLDLRIQLYSHPERREIAYSEIHHVTTNALGLFSVTIGEGLSERSDFTQIPWGDEEIWMEISVRLEGESDFTILSDSKMLSVPYAFHAATADALSGASHGGRGQSVSDTTLFWTIGGNKNIDPTRHKLGTLNLRDLVVVTGNTERMRVLSGGDINIIRNLNIGLSLAVGTTLTVGTNLTVGNNVLLNGAGGKTDIMGELKVYNGASTYLTGLLTVEKNTTLLADVNIYGLTKFTNPTQSTSPMNGAVVVAGGEGIMGNLNVGGDFSLGGSATFGGAIHISNTTQSDTTNTGALIVDGGVGIAKNLNVGGMMSVKGSSPGFMVKVQNKDPNAGDGIEIRLGRNHPAWNGSSYLNLTNPGTELFTDAINKVTAWINGTGYQPSDLVSMIPGAFLAGTACNLVNYLNNQLSSAIGLPLSVPETNIPGTPLQLFGGICFGFEIAGDDYNLGCVPPIGIPALKVPEIPLLPSIPDLPCSGLPSFSTPVLSFSNVSNSLTNSNQFLSFKDKDNRELGSVRAESVTNWQARYFDGTYFIGLMAEVAGIDFVSGTAGAIAAYTNIASAYNQIGVEYASGHGDYAEWLPRLNPAERIGDGDIVGVRGGQITKDLTDAEQVMAVSLKPIILGNAPAADREPLGNKIAFMGQIPVKVIGSVEIGDYIVGCISTPGYGKAVKPSAMTTDEAKRIVGRSWETNLQNGPKMVNTVIGIDNGHFLTMIQDDRKRMEDMETRLKALENKLMMMPDQGSNLNDSAQAFISEKGFSEKSDKENRETRGNGKK